MKSYTDLEQSKKLTEFLSIESADMYYYSYMSIGELFYMSYPNVIEDRQKLAKNDIPCWSLTALLSVLPYHLIIDNKRYEFRMIKGLNKNGETYAIEYVIFNTTFYFHLTGFYNNPVDACVAMIEKLHEQKFL